MLFAGGMNNQVLAVYDKVDFYNGSTQSWTSANALSVPRTKLAAAAAGSKVVFAGGENQNFPAVYATVDIWDTLTQNWTSITVAPTNMGSAAYRTAIQQQQQPSHLTREMECMNSSQTHRMLV